MQAFWLLQLPTERLCLFGDYWCRHLYRQGCEGVPPKILAQLVYGGEGVDIMNKYAEYIRNVLTRRELLEQLAEECNEMAKASLKMIRAGGMSNNMTPTSRDYAYDNFEEEQKDVISVLWLLTDNERYAYIDGYPKYERWAKRLGYKE